MLFFCVTGWCRVLVQGLCGARLLQFYGGGNESCYVIVPVYSYSPGSNCFIVADDGSAVLVDSGIDPGPALRRISELSLTLDALINTHAHYDHVKGNLAVVESTGADVVASRRTAEVLSAGNNQFILSELFGDLLEPMAVDETLGDGDTFAVGELVLEALETPGHSEGSICLYCASEKALFTGDTVFADGVGRTDLPGGSYDALNTSLERLISFAHGHDVEAVYPGHGPAGEASSLARNHAAL